MDNPKTPAENPAGPNASNSARPVESGVEPKLGATGIFGVVKTPETRPSAPEPGFTSLLRTLNSPEAAATPAEDPMREVQPALPPLPEKPGPAPAAPSPGGFTELPRASAAGDPARPPAPLAGAPEWAPSQTPSDAIPSAAGYPDSRQSHSPASLDEPVLNPSAEPSGMPGPSEFTRILDASPVRELAMMDGAGGANAVPATPTQSYAHAPAPLPNYPLPTAPPVAGMQGLGGMPQPGDFVPPQPPQVPGYPLNYGPHAEAIPSPGGGMPQMHGMVASQPIPAPQAPPAPPVQPVQPGMGKLQQMVPLLLVLVIVLLVVLLVTVIFLMKR